jgi:thioredoxin 1
MRVINKKASTSIAVFFIILFFCFSAECKIATRDIKDLKTTLKSGLPAVVKLGADYCHPCRMMKPILKELAIEQDGKAIFLDLNINENRDLAKEFKVMLIPTIIFYDKHGKVKGKTVGFMSKQDLLKKIEELKLNK